MSVEAELTRKARWALDQSPPPSRLPGLPAAGDVVVLERMGRFAVEWAVLASDVPPRSPQGDGARRRLLTVAADGMPLVGSRDVRVPGSLVLRCRFGGWVDAEVFTGAIRTAALAREDVDRALLRRSEVERGSVRGSIPAREVDDDLEYRDWIRETVEPAWSALSSLEARPRPLSRARRASGLRWLALAATLLLALGAGLLWQQHQKLRDLRAEVRLADGRHRQELEELQEGLEARHRQELEAAREQSEADAKRRLDEGRRELKAARARSVVRDFVAVSLEAPNGRRGAEKLIRVPPYASHVVFFMKLGKDAAGERHSAELLDLDTGELLLRLDELRGGRELRIGLPVELLPPGRYRMRILVPASAEPVVEAPFHIQREQGQREQGQRE